MSTPVQQAAIVQFLTVYNNYAPYTFYVLDQYGNQWPKSSIQGLIYEYNLESFTDLQTYLTQNQYTWMEYNTLVSGLDNTVTPDQLENLNNIITLNFNQPVGLFFNVSS